VKDTTQTDSKPREVSASHDIVEVALARAIEVEVEVCSAGWEGRVALLAGELKARRLALGCVVSLDVKRRKNGA
jgi:hypothetical protein